MLVTFSRAGAGMLSHSKNVLSCAKLWGHKARETDIATVFNKMLNSVVTVPLSTSTCMSTFAGILPARVTSSEQYRKDSC